MFPARKFVVDDYIPMAGREFTLFVEVAGFAHGHILS